MATITAYNRSGALYDPGYWETVDETLEVVSEDYENGDLVLPDLDGVTDPRRIVRRLLAVARYYCSGDEYDED